MRVAAASFSAVVLLLGFALLRAHPQRLAPYDRNVAILLAGKQVPEETDSFYFFVLDTETTIAQDGEEMAFLLQRAAAERDYLGIVGPDPERNWATLMHALDQSRGIRLDGVILIYVGPSTQADAVAEIIGTTGADLRFVVYPDESAPSI